MLLPPPPDISRSLRELKVRDALVLSTFRLTHTHALSKPCLDVQIWWVQHFYFMFYPTDWATNISGAFEKRLQELQGDLYTAAAYAFPGSVHHNPKISKEDSRSLAILATQS